MRRGGPNQHGWHELLRGHASSGAGFEIFLTARFRSGGPGPDGDAEPDGPILRQFMGGGGPRSLFTRWWAWPLPPAGPLEFVCEWPALEIPETRASIDAQLILDAAARSSQLWRDQDG